MKNNRNLEYYMSLNYPFTVEQYEENGELRFGAKIPDLPGVWAEGKTIEEAHADLIDTKRIWFETCLERGIGIPEPVSEKDFSGNFVLRVEPRLHLALKKEAKQKKISLNQHIKTMLEKQVRNSDLVMEIKSIGETLSKKIDELKEGFGSLDIRLKSLEDAFSILSDVVWINLDLEIEREEGPVAIWNKPVTVFPSEIGEVTYEGTAFSVVQAEGNMNYLYTGENVLICVNEPHAKE